MLVVPSLLQQCAGGELEEVQVKGGRQLEVKVAGFTECKAAKECKVCGLDMGMATIGPEDISQVGGD